MSKVLIIGAGREGKGFLGETFSADGWDVSFLDKDPKVISNLQNGAYDVKLYEPEGVRTHILTPVWMEYVLDESSVDKFAEYAKNVWDVDDNDKWNAAREGIRKTRECFTSWGMPTKLSELDIDDRYFGDMAQKAAVRGLDSAYKPLFEEDIVNILKRSL